MSLDTPTLPGEGPAAILCDDCPADLTHGYALVGRFLVCPVCAERRRQEQVIYLPPVKPRRARTPANPAVNPAVNLSVNLSAEVQK